MNSAHTKKVWPCSVTNEEEKELIFAAVEINPSSYIRDLALELNTDRETWRIAMWKEGYKSFNIWSI